MSPKLPRREREVFEILCAAAPITAAAVRARMADAPGSSAVRTLLSRLEGRGLVDHVEQDGVYLYSPTQAVEQVRGSALSQFVKTFFEGSAISAATALLGMSRGADEEELEALEAALAQARARAATEAEKQS
ncbi:BlaI/MecI/CopY family transcriptional regulator [Novosphingobium rosa]|uniref:BlaI/MecI/CopY family transcriptional regulator n=1 Tax=Novosphingobium rosa TaxID=76978 RepID=UPI0008297E75|nr:BlaI/MecI/CopY family transcriptional regulator [Novosphingobium rosa]